MFHPQFYWVFSPALVLELIVLLHLNYMRFVVKKHLLLLTLLSLFAFTHTAWGQARPTIEERLIRVEEGVKNLNIRFDDMNKRFDDLRSDMNKRFDALQGFMLWGFGILFSGMFILVGFILWDRRTTLAPVVKEL